MAGMPMSVAVLWDALRREAGVELRSADITPEKLGNFLIEIRTQGATAAQQQHTLLQGEYATAYGQYTQLQSELEPLEMARETLLAKVDDQLRRVMEQAAKYKLQGRQQRMSLVAQDQNEASAYMEHPKYTATVAAAYLKDWKLQTQQPSHFAEPSSTAKTYHEDAENRRAAAKPTRTGGHDLHTSNSCNRLRSQPKGLNATHREWVDKILFPCYMLRWQVEEAENALWVKHTAISIAEETYQLWTYEMQAAQMQMGQMEEEVDAEAYRAQLQRHFLEKRLEEIRLRNKERKKRLREERFLKKQTHELSRNATAASPSKADGKSRRSRDRGVEASHTTGSLVPASTKDRRGVPEKKRETIKQNRRDSSASPTGARKSGNKREYKIDPSAWL